MANRMRITTLKPAITKPKTSEHHHQVDRPVERWRPVPAGQITHGAVLLDEPGYASSPDTVDLRHDYKQKEDPHRDHDANDASRDGAPRVLGLFAQRGGRLITGKGGDAINHPPGDVGKLPVR